ncbi:hypothetical protein HDU93_003908, partial [Gonapodya sp. JEL0774]
MLQTFRYHHSLPYIIDVSQSVTPEHPHALEFLRRDCSNLVAYFNGKCVGEKEAQGEQPRESVAGVEGLNNSENFENSGAAEGTLKQEEGEDDSEDEEEVESAWRCMTAKEMFEFVVTGVEGLKQELSKTYIDTARPSMGAETT